MKTIEQPFSLSKKLVLLQQFAMFQQQTQLTINKKQSVFYFNIFYQSPAAGIHSSVQGLTVCAHSMSDPPVKRILPSLIPGSNEDSVPCWFITIAH